MAKFPTFFPTIFVLFISLINFGVAIRDYSDFDLYFSMAG
jgi:hypothetical protein